MTVVDHIHLWTSQKGQLAFVHCFGEAAVTTALITSCLLLKREKPLPQVLQTYDLILGISLSTPGLKTFLDKRGNYFPSHKRYIEYYHKLVNNNNNNNKEGAFAEGLAALDKCTMHLHKLRFNSIPSFSFSETCVPIFSVSQVQTFLVLYSDLRTEERCFSQRT